MKPIVKFSDDQLRSMLTLQDAMNKKIEPLWRQQRFKWHRAAWIECAELMEHVGWKWWKHTEPNIPQAKIEIIDIWHFALSFALQRMGNGESDIEKVIKRIREEEDLGSQELGKLYGFVITNGGKEMPHATVTELEAFRVAVEMLVTQCSGDTFVPPVMVCWVAGLLGMTSEEMYLGYVSKNVLNIFRQNNGYKQGTYIKNWGTDSAPVEDNVFLEQLLAENPSMHPDVLAVELGVIYSGVVARSTAS